ncbi:MAG TPA: hypothetical protein VEK11_04155 [Thermoanaerobaculia bacterium]|nr:hypothetical protein [Thermoanaerobaculia bacterium]
MPSFLIALLLTAFPSGSQTSWMRPESFRLAVGMSKLEVMKALDKWQPKPGKDANQLVVDYSDDKALTLDFTRDRLTSIRFELFVFLPEIRKAFEEEKQRLASTRGKPPKATKSILIYDNALPNVMVVVTDDPKSEQGRKGVGVLAVRYYDPR